MKHTVSHHKAENGFTLIEMCVCLIIVGFLMIPLAQSYMNTQASLKIEKTKENVRLTSSEVATFTALGRLPCPSDRSLPPGNANLGRELGLAAGVEPTATDIAALPVCTGAMQGLCRTAGARDTDADPDNLADPVIVGGVPFQALREADSGLKYDQTLDAWGNQLTYAVSARLCQTPPDPTNSTQMHKRGVIRLIDEFGNPTGGIGTRDLSTPPDGIPGEDDGQFVVLSHGEAGIGAYTQAGAAVANCTPVTREGENCDNDFIFMSALSSFKAADNNYFDDIAYAHLNMQNTLWDTISFISAGELSATADIRNLNDNNVGILTDNPTQRLHVAGNASADSANVTRICDENGANCFDYDFLRDRRDTGTVKRNTCATTGATAGRVITAIGNNTIVCGNPTLQAPGAIRRCADLIPYQGPYLRGILSNGEPICSN